ncbi:hypothetical protein SEPCBS119000_006703 [Sporothrix epigloea]|uniref:TMEM1 family protein n=1 Tax=Sporothrix epigloea TaxID=1892477 RepID=A0ABP0E7N5_9PEZI
MEPFSTSKVSVEYHDPHGLYRLLEPGLAARLPLRHLHWQSHLGPLRSIDTLHVELNSTSSGMQVAPLSLTPSSSVQQFPESTAAYDGFQVATTGEAGSPDSRSVHPITAKTAVFSPLVRRHQIPGLRRTPYLKLLFVRCDDIDTYKAQTRAEIKDWLKKHTHPEKGSSSRKRAPGVRENHDAYEWMIVHVVLPNTPVYSQSRISNSKSTGESSDSSTSKSAALLWSKNSPTILERMRSDFNLGSLSKSGVVIIDRVAQIRVAIEDVPYNMLPKAMPTTTDTTSTPGNLAGENDIAWTDFIDKLKSCILASFDARVLQYEDDIREKDVQRKLPGWNFCTFFILKEGLARDFESVGLVEDALVGYDELSVGLDTVLLEQASLAGSTLLKFTKTLKKATQKALNAEVEFNGSDNDETVDLQAAEAAVAPEADCSASSVPISASKKAYRDMILANDVSVFDFRCYIFARQVALLLRLGNAATTHDELLIKMQEQASIEFDSPTPPLAFPASSAPKNFLMLAEICRRTLDFIPVVSRVMREDLLFAFKEYDQLHSMSFQNHVDDTVASFAFSVAQQILAQTSACVLPTALAMPLTTEISELKVSFAEPKTMMHPARNFSLGARNLQERSPPSLAPPSGSNHRQSEDEPGQISSTKLGLPELAAWRADLYLLSRNILQKLGQKRGWYDGWSAASVFESNEFSGMDVVEVCGSHFPPYSSLAGVANVTMRTALESCEGFTRLYQVLSEKAIRHYTVAGQTHAARSSYADLAALKFYQQDYVAAVSYFHKATHFSGENNWSLLELSMLLMYAECFKNLGRQEEYAQGLLRFLTKASGVERQRRKQSAARFEGSDFNKPTTSSVCGRLSDLLEASLSVPKLSVPLTAFFRAVTVDGSPVYAEGQDRFTVSLRLDSLLADSFPIDSFNVRLAQPSVRGSREIWLKLNDGENCTLDPGWNTVHLHSNMTVPGFYEIDQIRVNSKNLLVFYDRRSTSAPTLSSENSISADASEILSNPFIVLYQRTDALDIQLSTSRNLQLDKNNQLELALLSGWNNIENCEMRIRAATGGLRLITTDAKVSDSVHTFSAPVEGGIVRFDAISANTVLRISFPFSVEQDLLELCLKVDVTYTTANGVFHFFKMPCVSTSLPLGVNVQDVFKHDALFSRFTVSTATPSPIRVFCSELLESDQFAPCHDGANFSRNVHHNTDLPVIFPKQPVSLLYKIIRKPASHHKTASTRKSVQRIMYIKLQYSVFQEQLDAALEASLSAFFREIVTLRQFAKFAIESVLRHVHASLTSSDLEKITLLHEMQTSVLAHVHWYEEFSGLGTLAADLAAAIFAWQKQHPVLSISKVPAPNLLRAISIPVDIPCITILHTADIQLRKISGSGIAAQKLQRMAEDETVDIPVYCVNQLLPATLHLRWTRIWDTSDALPQDLEFSFDVSAPNDAWIIGGRRKGHFVIPAPGNIRDDTATDGEDATVSSTPALEATIPLILIPLREGQLSYPSVEIREVIYSNPDDQDSATSAAHHCETDYRNLGDTVHVMQGRKRLTLSLDASGPDGGLMVLESRQTCVNRFVL